MFMTSIDSHLAEVVVVAEVQVAGGVGRRLVLGDHLQHRQRVEDPGQEDDPHVQGGLQDRENFFDVNNLRVLFYSPSNFIREPRAIRLWNKVVYFY